MSGGHLLSRSRPVLLALVVTVGFQLRSVVLAVPPALPAIRDDLHLSFTAAGTLTALPVLCLGAAALPGAVLVSRVGARIVVGAATVGLGLAAVLRLAPPVPIALFAFSAVMALCVAVAQPAMTVVIRAWFPGALQQAGTIFAIALSLGGLGGSTLGVHLLGLLGWRGSFVAWAALAVVAGIVWLALAPGRRGDHQPQPSGLAQVLRDRSAWHVAAIFGTQSLVFYAASSWLPFLLRSRGPAYLSLVLLILNVIGLPLMFVLAALPWPWARSRGFYVLAGLLMTAGTGGLALGLIDTAWLWVILMGVGTGMCFGGTVTLPALFARGGQVAAYTAVVLTAGYAISFAGPFLGGLLLDHTHQLTSPFWLMTAIAAGLILLGLTLPRREASAASG